MKVASNYCYCWVIRLCINERMTNAKVKTTPTIVQNVEPYVKSFMG